MSDPVIDNSEDPVDERLTEVVSYLDAELDDTGMNAVELRLVKDASLREYADALDRTWQLLDAIEDVSASEQFTRRTVASITTEALQGSRTAEENTIGPLRTLAQKIRRRKIVPWFLTGVLGACLGLTVSHRMQDRRSPDTNAAILKDLDLLRNYSRYRVLPDVDSLRKLQLPHDPAAEKEPLP